MCVFSLLLKSDISVHSQVFVICKDSVLEVIFNFLYQCNNNIILMLLEFNCFFYIRIYHTLFIYHRSLNRACSNLWYNYFKIHFSC